MTANHLPSSAPGPLSASRAAPPVTPRQVAPKHELTLWESLAVGFALVFGLEPFLADWPPQPAASAADKPNQFDLKG